MNDNAPLGVFDIWVVVVLLVGVAVVVFGAAYVVHRREHATRKRRAGTTDRRPPNSRTSPMTDNARDITTCDFCGGALDYPVTNVGDSIDVIVLGPCCAPEDKAEAGA